MAFGFEKEVARRLEWGRLEYLLPRLKRMWAHLSRIRGGIGLRRPDETQLETDRRMIRKKIGVLKEKLGHVAEHRGRMRLRSRERGVLRVALVGYTNAGKSSLLNALTRTDAHVEDRLFATLDTASRETQVNGKMVRFADTVGFIRKLPHDLVASFGATLEETAEADVLLHVVDVSHPAWEQQAVVVSQALEQVGVDGVMRSLVVALNKADLLSREEREERLGIARGWGWEAELVSAARGFGLEALGTRVVGFSRRGEVRSV